MRENVSSCENPQKNLALTEQALSKSFSFRVPEPAKFWLCSNGGIDSSETRGNLPRGISARCSLAKSPRQAKPVVDGDPARFARTSNKTGALETVEREFSRVLGFRTKLTKSEVCATRPNAALHPVLASLLVISMDYSPVLEV